MLMAGIGHGRKAAPTAGEAIRLLFPYREKVRTITTDNGCEFAAHLDITRGLAMKGWEPVIVYFADSYCSWQKGPPRTRTSSSGGNIPKQANFNDFSDSRIKAIQYKLNRRPREKINFVTPKDRFYQNSP